jgi:hypothetical protein
VLPCSKRYVHDWTECPYAHPQEKARRRDPRLHNYTGIACPSMKKASGAVVGYLAQVLAAHFLVDSCDPWRPASLPVACSSVSMTLIKASSDPLCSTPSVARLCHAWVLASPTPDIAVLGNPCHLQEGCCAFGDHCPYAHNVFEYWLHPTRYRTQLCNDGSNCKRKICFFAHRCGVAGLPGCAAGSHERR